MTVTRYCSECGAGPFGNRGLALHERKRHPKSEPGRNRAQRRGKGKAEHTLQTLPRSIEQGRAIR